MKKILVDGHEYTVEQNGRYGEETVTVAIDYTDIVAVAEIVHNVELIAVAYECRNSNEILTSDYPYCEYTTPEELARWMVATHPEHQ